MRLCNDRGIVGLLLLDKSRKLHASTRNLTHNCTCIYEICMNWTFFYLVAFPLLVKLHLVFGWLSAVPKSRIVLPDPDRTIILTVLQSFSYQSIEISHPLPLKYSGFHKNCNFDSELSGCRYTFGHKTWSEELCDSVASHNGKNHSIWVIGLKDWIKVIYYSGNQSTAQEREDDQQQHM